jgi:hypothetical protein
VLRPLPRIVGFALALLLGSWLSSSGSAALGYELEPELRQHVDRLIAEVTSSPTTSENAASRVAVLWEWANVVSLQGGYVPKNLPATVWFMTSPIPGRPLAPWQYEAADDFVRQLAWLDEDPGAFGSIAVSGQATFEAGSWASLVVTWRVGSLGVGEGGGLVVSTHAAGGYGRLQTSEPAGDHYVSARVSRGGVDFEEGTAAIWGPYGGFRQPADYPTLRLRGGALHEGDTVTLTYGDRSQGSRGLQVPPFSNDAIALPLHVDLGDGRVYELPLPTFGVTGGRGVRVHGFAPSIVAVGELFEISIRTEDSAYSRATRDLPGYEVRRNGEVVATLPAGQAIHRLPITLEREGVYRYSFRSPDGRVTGVANPIWVQEAPEFRIFWGETHGHCGFAEGQGTPEGYFTFARDDARLDFVTLSEHDVWLTDGLWKVLDDTVREFRREGEIIVFPGYEWSQERRRGGHHNVFFRGPGFQRVGVQIAPDLTQLYRELRARYETDDVLIIPHAHQNGDWRISDLEMETLIEIMSGHGTFEWFGQRYLQSGYRAGFVAASDDHRGHPGYSPGHPQSNPRRRSNIFQAGGLAAVLASEKSTDSIFDSLKARRVYGTTGSRRIVLDARLNGVVMGSELELTEDRSFEGRVLGTAPIRKIDLIRDGEVAATYNPRGAVSGVATAEQTEVAVAFHSESWVDIRDNPRGQRVWRGLLTVEGATIGTARLLGTPHYQADSLEIDGHQIRFSVSTRGSRRVLGLVLDGASAATRLHFEIDEAREFGIAPTQVRTRQHFEAAAFTLSLPMRDTSSAAQATERILEAGPYRDSVRVDLVEGLRDDVSFRFFDRGEAANWYYLRVEQIDGHLAWSSPWWVGGERPR